ncbi:MAG TPA: glycosyltransferase family A protein [Iamia sp.]|nr:glycosyltransferase family A protein [Iamia sp.]
MTDPRATVVVATRNRSALLPRLVAALEAQEGAPPFEVVIVDDASTDATPSVLATLAASTPLDLRLERQDVRGGQSAGRDRGWRAARGDLVLFTDDDCVPRPGWVAALAAALDEADLVQGRTIPAPDQAANEGPFSRTLEVTEANGTYATCNMGYRRAWLEKVDGFDVRYRQHAGEDTDLALRCVELGAGPAFAADAVVEHDVRPSSFGAALRGTWRWHTLPTTLARHPDLAAAFHSTHVWRESHLPTAPALAGVVAGGLLAVGRRPGLGVAVAALAGLPYASYRLRRVPVTPSKPRRIALLPATLVVDGAEVVALLAGSARARRLLL